jgi:hypothetical protein
VLFVGLALWLARGAPRPRLVAPLAALGLVVLVLYLPLGGFVSLAAIPDAFTFIPLYRLQVRSPGFDVELLVDVVASVAAAAFVLVPRRLVLVLPAMVLVVLAAISVHAGRVVAGQAALVRLGSVGDVNRWIDPAADGPVAYLYTGDVLWPSTYALPFWNRDVKRIYTLGVVSIDGPLPRTAVNVEPNGRVLAGTLPYVAASNALTFVGTRIAFSGPPQLSLWRVEPPLRLAEWIQGVVPGGLVPKRARIEIYGCERASLRLELVAQEPRAVKVTRNDRTYRRLRLEPGRAWRETIPVSGGGGLCSFNLDADGPVLAPRLEVVRMG